MDDINVRHLNDMYFATHFPGTVSAYIDHDIRFTPGPITMSLETAKEVRTNLDLQISIAEGIRDQHG